MLGLACLLLANRVWEVARRRRILEAPTDDLVVRWWMRVGAAAEVVRGWDWRRRGHRARGRRRGQTGRRRREVGLLGSVFLFANFNLCHTCLIM